MAWLFNSSQKTAEWVESIYAPVAVYKSSLFKLWTQMTTRNWEDMDRQLWGKWVDM